MATKTKSLAAASGADVCASEGQTQARVTAHHEFYSATRDGKCLFAICGGIPLNDAFDELSRLLAMTRYVLEPGAYFDGSEDAAKNCMSAGLRMLAFGEALTEAIHTGYLAAERSGAKS